MISIRELHVVLSDYCNIKCNYCSVYKKKDVSQYIIDKEALKLANSVRDKALLENVHFDIITLTGGEPTTVSPSVLAKCINILQDVCNIVSIQTNGVSFGRHQYFNSFKKNIKNKYKLNISISCDGPQGIHDLNRDNSYKYVEKAIDRSIKYIGEVGLVCVVGKHTVENKDIFKAWIETILKNKAIHPQIRVEMGKDRMTDSEQVKLGKIIIDNGLYPYSEVGRRTTLNKGNDCDTLVVSTNTIVRGCLKFTNTEVELDMSSINENTFGEIITKRKELFSSILISEDCKTCKYKDVCNSGCPLFRKSTGKANECFLRKTVYKEDCNLYGEDSGCFKKVVKSVKKAAKKVSKSVKKVTKIVKSVAKVVTGVFGKVAKELERTVENLEQTVKVLSGQYHDDVKEVEKYQKKVEDFGDKLEDRANAYNSNVDALVDKMEGLIAFHEIFQMAIGNRLDVLSSEYSAEMSVLNDQYSFMVAELKRMIAKIQSEYDFVIGLTNGAFLQRIVGSIIMIIGGLMSDLKDVISGDANGDTWKRIGMVIVLVVLIIIAILFPPAWALVAGPGSAMTVTYMIILGLMMLNAFITLDGMYANGAATGAIMGVLDAIFNDLLNLDDLIGSDFDKFDKDHDDYSQMVGYVQLAIGLTQVYLAWTSSSVYYAAKESAAREAAFSAGGSVNPEASMLGIDTSSSNGFFDTATVGQSAPVESGIESYFDDIINIDSNNFSNSSVLGVKFKTFSNIYEAFESALKIKDYVDANQQYEDINRKLKEEIDKVNAAITSKTNKNMMKHYKDSEYFLQDQQEYIDRYIYSMTADNMYVDPYGTTPVANIRFTPDKDTRMMSFGFEDMFNENKMAGSKNYFNSIIYGG